jgi:hypothetical protein
VGTRLVYKLSGENLAGEGFIAGLVHDIGKLFLGKYFAEDYTKVVNSVREDRCDLLTAEKRTFSATHSAVGAWLLDEWNLPHWLVETIEKHHDTSYNQQSKLTTSVAFANHLVQQTTETPSLCGVDLVCSKDLIEFINLKTTETGEVDYEFYHEILRGEFARSEGFANTICPGKRVPVH